MRAKYPTITISKEKGKRLGLDEGPFACAGPYPNIMGMKQKYWGMDAMCIKCGVYVYKVDEITYLNCGGAV